MYKIVSHNRIHSNSRCIWPSGLKQCRYMPLASLLPPESMTFNNQVMEGMKLHHFLI